MSTSTEQGPRLRGMNYEPTTTQGAACPHCGATIDPTSSAAVAAEVFGFAREVPVVTVPDVEAVVAGVVRVQPDPGSGRYHCLHAGGLAYIRVDGSMLRLRQSERLHR